MHRAGARTSGSLLEMNVALAFGCAASRFARSPNESLLLRVSSWIMPKRPTASRATFKIGSNQPAYAPCTLRILYHAQSVRMTMKHMSHANSTIHSLICER
jgi:hypothetical protein